jgi:hypothetical protein
VLATLGTVGLSLATAAIGGGAALAVAYFNARETRLREWRGRLVAAAADFTHRFAGAQDALMHALSRVNAQDADATARNADYLAGETAPFQGPIALLFGDASPAAKSAKAAGGRLRGAARYLLDEGRSPGERKTGASEELAVARRAHEAFMRAVLDAVRPTGPVLQGSVASFLTRRFGALTRRRRR